MGWTSSARGTERTPPHLWDKSPVQGKLDATNRYKSERGGVAANSGHYKPAQTRRRWASKWGLWHGQAKDEISWIKNKKQQQEQTHENPRTSAGRRIPCVPRCRATLRTPSRSFGIIIISSSSSSSSIIINMCIMIVINDCYHY